MQRRERACCGDLEDGPTATATGASSAHWRGSVQVPVGTLDQRSGVLAVDATASGAKVVQRG